LVWRVWISLDTFSRASSIRSLHFTVAPSSYRFPSSSPLLSLVHRKRVPLSIAFSIICRRTQFRHCHCRQPNCFSNGNRSHSSESSSFDSSHLHTCSIRSHILHVFLVTLSLSLSLSLSNHLELFSLQVKMAALSTIENPLISSFTRCSRSTGDALAACLTLACH
jgi:hypothetical protein